MLKDGTATGYGFGRAIGEYAGHQFITHRIVTREGDKLYAQRTGGARDELIPYSNTEFFVNDPPDRFRFVRDPGGKVTAVERLRVINYGPPEIAQRTDKPIPKERQAVAIDPKLFDTYAGDYELAPGVSLSVTQGTPGHYYAQLTGEPKFEILAESGTQFFLKDVNAQLEFQRDASGKETEVVLHQAGESIHCKRK